MRAAVPTGLDAIVIQRRLWRAPSLASTDPVLAALASSLPSDPSTPSAASVVITTTQTLPLTGLPEELAAQQAAALLRWAPCSLGPGGLQGPCTLGKG